MLFKKRQLIVKIMLLACCTLFSTFFFLYYQIYTHVTVWFLVSEKLVLPKYEDVYEKLVRALDNPVNHLIANWEHLACAEDIKAPPLVHVKCKLSTNYSHTAVLLEVLAVRENEEVVTVKDLIAALVGIERNDIVKMITDVHCGMFNHFCIHFCFYVQCLVEGRAYLRMMLVQKLDATNKCSLLIQWYIFYVCQQFYSN